MKNKISKIISSNSEYKNYINKFFVPKNSTLEKTIDNFSKFLISKESWNLDFLVKLLKEIDDEILISGQNFQDQINSVDVLLRSLDIYQLLSFLSFSFTKNKNILFHSYKKIDFSILEKNIHETFFNNENIWTISAEKNFSLCNIFDYEEGYLLFFNTKGKEYKFFDKNLQFINEFEPGYISLYISKKGFLSIGGIKSKKHLISFQSYLKVNLGIEVKTCFSLLMYMSIFESNSLRITRKGDIETKGKNQIQNSSARHTKDSDLRYKDFFGDIFKIGGYFKIDTIKDEINLGFSGNTNYLNIAKSTLTHLEYVFILEYFYRCIINGNIKEQSLNEIFKSKLSGKKQLIVINEEEFYDHEKSLEKYENKYGVKFEMYGNYQCKSKKCTHRQIKKSDWIQGNIKCSNCGIKYDFSDIQNHQIELKSFFLDFDNDYYSNLLPVEFIQENGKEEKIGKFEKVYSLNGEKYNFYIHYGLFDKTNIRVNNNDHLINIFLTPDFISDEVVFEVIDNKNKNVYLSFGLDIFDTIKDKEKRNKLFESILKTLIKQETILKQTNITAGRDVKGVITESDNSTLNT